MVDYHEYMASREWALKKREVRKRCKGICERCSVAPMSQVHHRTYERLGNELLTDLWGLCRPCHEYLSAKRDVDPKDEIRSQYQELRDSNNWGITDLVVWAEQSGYRFVWTDSKLVARGPKPTSPELMMALHNHPKELANYLKHAPRDDKAYAWEFDVLVYRDGTLTNQKHLKIQYRETGNVQDDEVLMDDLKRLLMEYLGEDEVSLELVTDHRIVALAWPAMKVNACAELVQQLQQLLGPSAQITVTLIVDVA